MLIRSLFHSISKIREMSDHLTLYTDFSSESLKSCWRLDQWTSVQNHRLSTLAREPVTCRPPTSAATAPNPTKLVKFCGCGWAHSARAIPPARRQCRLSSSAWTTTVRLILSYPVQALWTRKGQTENIHAKAGEFCAGRTLSKQREKEEEEEELTF